jgi:sulfopyruvate decarboxylase TPP-binding subunit
MGQATAPVLQTAGVIVCTVEKPDDVADTVDAAARLAFESSRATAVLIDQRVIGSKRFE